MENIENTATVDTATIEQEQQGHDNEVKTYTEEEVSQLLQREADRRVSQALAKQKNEYEKKLSLSKLDERERAYAEKDMRIQELQEKLAAFEVEKNRSELKSVLSSRGLSAEFADLIEVSDNLDESQARIDTLDKLFKAAVAEEVRKRLAANGTKPQQANANAELTRESARKLNMAQLSALQAENPELFNKLFG